MTLTADGQQTYDDIFTGMQLIDCDAHFTEPTDLWTSRAAASMRDRVPVRKTVDGRTDWYLDGELWASTGGNTIRRERQKMLGTHIVHPFEEIDPASWSVAERIKLMDEMGFYAQVLYPNGIGFASNHIFAIEDLDQRRVVLTTYNDFLVDLQEESGGRLFPQAMLPIWDIDLTVREMTRLLDKGIRGFTLSDKPELLGLAELPHRSFDPMWDLFNQSGAVANFHIGAGMRREERVALHQSRLVADPNRGGPLERPPAAAESAWRYFGHQRRMVVTATLGFLSNVRIIANLCTSDLFDRYPSLKIVSAESGIGWVPFLLEALEFQLDENVTDPDELALQQRRPTEYFRDHISVMFWFEQLGPQKLIEDIGADNVLIETDVPHPTCLYPGGRERLASVMAELRPDVRRKVLQDNAARLYNIDLAGAG